MRNVELWIIELSVEIEIVLALLLAALLYCVLFQVWRVVRRNRRTRRNRHQRCEHENVIETQACDAICLHCGQNLGFIQNWRDAQQRAADKQ